MTKNKVFAVKRMGELWAAIDCGPTKQGGMTVGNFWMTHFKKDGRTYRWYDKLFNPPTDLVEWQEIQVLTKQVTIVDSPGNLFENWEDADDLCYKTLQKFTELIEQPMTLDEIKQKIIA